MSPFVSLSFSWLSSLQLVPLFSNRLISCGMKMTVALRPTDHVRKKEGEKEQFTIGTVKESFLLIKVLIIYLNCFLNKALGIRMQQAYVQRKNTAEFSQFSVVTGKIDYTDTISPTGSNEGHFLKHIQQASGHGESLDTFV